MGMFEKDAYFKYDQMEQVIAANDPFVIYGIEVVDGFPLPEGSDRDTCEQARLTVAPADKPTKGAIVSTLAGPITANAKLAEPSDFPRLVIWKKVAAGQKGFNDATVLQEAPVPDADLEKVHKLDPKKVVIGAHYPTPF